VGVQIAINGKGFCGAAGKATGLIINNILRVGAVNIIGDLILFLGKVCVSFACALFAFLMLDTHKYKSGNNKVSSPLFPVLVSGTPFTELGIFIRTLLWSMATFRVSFHVGRSRTRS
jgi:choline transporter-like protein 2/4/5